MKDAPERIKAWVDYDGDVDGHWLLEEEPVPPHAALYVRADLLEAQAAQLQEAREHAAGLWAEFTDEQRERLRHKFADAFLAKSQ